MATSRISPKIVKAGIALVLIADVLAPGAWSVRPAAEPYYPSHVPRPEDTPITRFRYVWEHGGLDSNGPLTILWPSELLKFAVMTALLVLLACVLLRPTAVRRAWAWMTRPFGSHLSVRAAMLALALLAVVLGLGREARPPGASSR